MEVVRKIVYRVLDEILYLCITYMCIQLPYGQAPRPCAWERITSQQAYKSTSQQVNKPTSLQAKRLTKNQSKIHQKSTKDVSKINQNWFKICPWGTLGEVWKQSWGVWEESWPKEAPRSQKRSKKGPIAPSPLGGFLGAMLAISWAKLGQKMIKFFINI